MSISFWLRAKWRFRAVDINEKSNFLDGIATTYEGPESTVRDVRYMLRPLSHRPLKMTFWKRKRSKLGWTKLWERIDVPTDDRWSADDTSQELRTTLDNKWPK